MLFSSLNSSVCGLSCGSLASFSYVGLLASCAWKKLMQLGVKCWEWTQHMLLMCFGHGCSFQPPRHSPGGSDYNFLATSFDEYSTDWCSFHHSIHLFVAYLVATSFDEYSTDWCSFHHSIHLFVAYLVARSLRSLTLDCWQAVLGKS